MEETPIIAGNAENDSVSTTSDISSKVKQASKAYLKGPFDESELVIGLVGAVGTEFGKVIDLIRTCLAHYKYEVQVIRVSKDVIEECFNFGESQNSEYERISQLMDLGNTLRERSKDNAVLALGSAAAIYEKRPKDGHDSNRRVHRPKTAYIISSLKHPEEIACLRQIYAHGFFLMGVYSDEVDRKAYLVNRKQLTDSEADKLIARDMDEELAHGQSTRETFHLSDFFVHMGDNDSRITSDIHRILNLMFGEPLTPPTFDEFAMFMAFSSSLCSADLSRQVGAVIAKDKDIIGTGANDCPKYGGGHYWPEYDTGKKTTMDVEKGRDYKIGYDSNKREKDIIIRDIVERLGHTGIAENMITDALKGCRIGDITEYGRVVHAEMDALLSCARSGVSPIGGVLYCTTFPCHNCAKHIIAAGIKRVVYIEPYSRSKAEELHKDSIHVGFNTEPDFVAFEPFMGVGPRRFFDLFSMRLGSGYPIKRKDNNGNAVKWDASRDARLRTQLAPCSYIDIEDVASKLFNELIEELRNE